MKLTPLLMSGVIALAMSLPIVGCAQQANDQTSAPHGARGHHGMMAAMRGVNLSDQQKAQIKQITDQYRQAHPEGSAPDPAARKAMRDQVMSVLTPDQQAQFKTNLEAMRAHRSSNPQPQATPSPS